MTAHTSNKVIMIRVALAAVVMMGFIGNSAQLDSALAQNESPRSAKNSEPLSRISRYRSLMGRRPPNPTRIHANNGVANPHAETCMLTFVGYTPR